MNPAEITNCKVEPLWAKVDELYAKHVSENQIRQLIDEQMKQVKVHKLNELLDFIASLRRMINMGALGILESTIKNFLLQHVSEINVNEIWKILEKSGKQLKSDIDYSKNQLAISNTDNALFILWCFLRPEFVIKRIIDMIENKKIHTSIVRYIFTKYTIRTELCGVTGLSDYHGMIFQSDFVDIGWDLFYKLLILVLNDKSYFEQKSLSKDYFISSFKDIYNSVPGELSKEHLKLLFENIRNTDQKIWRDKLNMTYENVISFVKKTYKYKNKNNNFSLIKTSTDDIAPEDIKLLGIIFTNTLFKRELKDEIDEFLRNNPVSLYWQVSIVMSVEHGEDDITIRNFIRDNIGKFSYTDIFQHLLSAIVTFEDRALITLYILLQLKGCKDVLSDIEQNFKKGKIKLPELKFLLRAYCGMLEFYLGVKPDKTFTNGLKRIIENN